GEEGEIQRWAETATTDDDAFVRVLENLTRQTRARSVASNYIKVHLLIDPDDVGLILDVPTVSERVESMLEDPAVSADHKKVLQRFVVGKRARDRGDDP